jgi:hypothetical protein
MTPRRISQLRARHSFAPPALAAKLRRIADEIRRRVFNDPESDAMARRLDAYADSILNPEPAAEAPFAARLRRLQDKQPGPR